jgi:septal ring factor EnvC (AmiA/AmiB activator)
MLNIKGKSTLILVIVFALVLIIFSADVFMNMRFKTTLKDFRSVVTEANKDSSETKIRNVQMQDELNKNKTQIDEVSSLNSGLKSQLDQTVKVLQDKEQALAQKEAQISAMQVDLANAKASCGDPEKVKADELKMKLESAFGPEAK